MWHAPCLTLASSCENISRPSQPCFLRNSISGIRSLRRFSRHTIPSGPTVMIGKSFQHSKDNTFPQKRVHYCTRISLGPCTFTTHLNKSQWRPSNTLPKPVISCPVGFFPWRRRRAAVTHAYSKVTQSRQWAGWRWWCSRLMIGFWNIRSKQKICLKWSNCELFNLQIH